MSDIKVGDEVRVFDISGKRVGQPDGGWPGKVVKVGRKLVHIEYIGRAKTFRLVDRKADDSYGHRYFMTLEQVALSERRQRALDVLKRNAIRLDHGHQLSLEQIEALAEVARRF
jgi:hypothetical protein